MRSKQLTIEPEVLPLSGMSRFSQFQKFLPLSREKFRQLSKAGKAPKGMRMGSRLTMYSNQELHRFFANPLNYKSKEL
ncbi:MULTISPECIES: transcriptional regulator [unclassified Polynucleobacter]|jgi:predicted DNA-binding transcriptional regulator AlpA|uniref:transcriptional regulator n=1 Tax=unclassified Polynucleobacter TaxID=2640945 RepID=UPI001C0BFA0B|nr:MULTISPECIES: transcriptional regulator [unclassified Polynucleobacter]MBU3562361.1 transcriptional regulator [Polynucleobacter sp. Tro8-14-1]MEA9568394.1 transcriptional regulator [Polynucleobacter sp. AP-Nickl1-40-C4]